MAVVPPAAWRGGRCRALQRRGAVLPRGLPRTIRLESISRTRRVPRKGPGRTRMAAFRPRADLVRAPRHVAEMPIPDSLSFAYTFLMLVRLRHDGDSAEYSNLSASGAASRYGHEPCWLFMRRQTFTVMTNRLKETAGFEKRKS